MKTLGLAGLLIGACILLSGCPGASFFGHDPVNFSLSLSFQDAAGKNRVEGIGYTANGPLEPSVGQVEPELYTLRLFEDGKKLYPRGVQGEDFSAIKYLRYAELLRDPLVSHYLYLYYDGTESKKTFTAFLTCPYIFGDSTEHEITSYWKRKSRGYVCTRFTFDGEDIDIIGQEYGDVIAVIVLD